MKLLLCIVAVACLRLVTSQCSRESVINATILGPLIAESLRGSSVSPSPQITIMDSKIVCLAADTVQDTYRTASLIVRYNCDGSSTICTTGDPNEVIFSQIELECINGDWDHFVTGTQEGNIEPSSMDSFMMTDLRIDCAFCLSNGRLNTALEPHHCVPCSENCTGLGVCTNVGDDGCCNVYSSKQCREECTLPSIPDPNFVCRVNCTADPPTAQFQTVTYDDQSCTYEGCNVTYRCQDGLSLANGQDSYQLNCVRRNNILAEWDGTTQTCSEVCMFPPLMATVTYSPTGCDNTFSPMACSAQYTCLNESAACNCTVNGTTGSVKCLSDSVTKLLENPDCQVKPSEPMTDLLVVYITVPTVVGVVIICVVVGILVISIYYFWKKTEKFKNGTRVDKTPMNDIA